MRVPKAYPMYTATLAVDNVLGAAHDTWSVNVDAEYHEEVKNPTSDHLRETLVPQGFLGIIPEKALWNKGIRSGNA